MSSIAASSRSGRTAATRARISGVWLPCPGNRTAVGLESNMPTPLRPAGTQNRRSPRVGGASGRVGGVVARRMRGMCAKYDRGVSTTPPPAHTLFDAIGGEPAFRRIVARFFAQVAADPILRAVYTDEDLGPAADRLALFLMQYWG